MKHILVFYCSDCPHSDCNAINMKTGIVYYNCKLLSGRLNHDSATYPGSVKRGEIRPDCPLEDL